MPSKRPVRPADLITTPLINIGINDIRLFLLVTTKLKAAGGAHKNDKKACRL